MKLLRFTVFVLCLVPLLLTIYGAITNTLGVNPVETMIRRMGDWAFYLLLITLTVTPLRQISGWSGVIRFRRMLGLYSFFYACVHFLTYIWFDHFFNWTEILQDIIKRPFITVGFISLLLLLALAVTSNQFMISRLRKNWARLHKLVYVIAILVLFHYFMMIKADYYEPLIFAVILTVLLGWRVVRVYTR